MSSSDQGQQGDAGRDRRSFGKFIRRTSKMMKPKEQDATASSAARPSNAAAPATAAKAARSPSPSAPPVPPKSPPRNPPSRRPVPLMSPGPARDPSPEVVRATPTNAAHHYRLQEQKARALFAKYNMTLEDGEWQRARSATAVEWVEKKHRLRVHRQCHRCQTGFGGDKVCQQCTHTRCKKCPRVPDKVIRDSTKLPHQVAVDSHPKYQPAPRSDKLLTIEGKHGKDLVRKHPVHRVRRTCHKCETLFVGKATKCESCQHDRCPKCPREPYVDVFYASNSLTAGSPKEKKYPNGYPGDTPETFPLAERAFKSTRQRVRWECHQCQTFFGTHTQSCPKCQHQRCDSCNRHPPKKVKREAHPDVVSGLEAKLERMQVSTAA